MRFLKILYVQVLIAIALGVLVGVRWPEVGTQLKPLADGFIALIRMLIAPIIFCTVTAGIAHMSDLKKFGRVGGKAILYFELVSTLALGIGIAVAELIQPGRGFDMAAVAAKVDPAVAGYIAKAKTDTVVEHLLAIIPKTFLAAFAEGEILQVLLLAILTGFALARLGELGAKGARALDQAMAVFFAILSIVVRAAPVGAFGAMGFTIGKYGLKALIPLGNLIGSFYLTSILFVLVVLGLIAWMAGFSILRFIAYIKEELLIVLGTSSSETVLPQMMQKLQRMGASKSVVGLVIPAGYSFNLDGTNIYMTLATLFLAQATGVHLSWTQELTVLAVAMLTSKGASGVTGSGFIVLAATLQAVPSIPIESMAVLLGIDRFMSECRALTNLVGNGVATLVVAGWEKELDRGKLHAELRRGAGSPGPEPVLAGPLAADVESD
jgi:aerobic C4-dicarboxylate transport protein